MHVWFLIILFLEKIFISNNSYDNYSFWWTCILSDGYRSWTMQKNWSWWKLLVNIRHQVQSRTRRALRSWRGGSLRRSSACQGINIAVIVEHQVDMWLCLCLSLYPSVSLSVNLFLSAFFFCIAFSVVLSLSVCFSVFNLYISHVSVCLSLSCSLLSYSLFFKLLLMLWSINKYCKQLTYRKFIYIKLTE